MRRFSAFFFVFFVFLFMSPFAFANCSIHYGNDAQNHGHPCWKLYGDVMQWAIPAGALGWSLFDGDSDGVSRLTASYGSTMIVSYGLKALVRRDRPYPHISQDSFPSGHTASAFSGSFYLWRRYGWRVGIVPSVLAAGVGYSRVITKWHHPTDVIGATFLAAGFSFLLVKSRSREVKIDSAKDGMAVVYHTEF